MSTQGLSGGAFDFDTQAGIAQLLASVRAANISAEDKNDLRDTIFLYTNGGRDQTVRLSLEQKLHSSGIQPVAPLIQINKDQSPMSFSRSTPSGFSVSKTIKAPTQTPQSAAQPVVSAPAPVEPAPASTVNNVPPDPVTSNPLQAQSQQNQTPATPPPQAAPVPASQVAQPQSPVTPVKPAPVQPPVQNQTPPPAPAPVQPQPKPQAPPAATSPAPPKPAPSPAPAPVTPTPSPVSPPQAPVSAPIQNAAPPSTQIKNPADQTTVASSPTNNQPAPTNLDRPADQIVPGQSPEVYLTRIKEIKSLVNQKVGNPVNLVDIDNEVGREYMGALLDAMKKINSGASAVSAMKRLEDSYKSVEKVVSSHENKVLPNPVSATPPPQAAPVPASQVAQPQSPVTPVKPAPVQPPVQNQTPPPAPAPVTPTPSPVSPSQVTEPTVAPAPKPIPNGNSVASPDKKVEDKTILPPDSVSVEKSPKIDQKQKEIKSDAQTEQKPPAGAAKPSQPKSRIPIQDIPPSVDTEVSDDDGRWSKSPTPTPVTASEVPQAPKSGQKVNGDDNTVTEGVKGTEEGKSAVDDPLYSSEIDDGLNQLLSEWSLFKKSGLFGTGPKGREHPLFKKVANLQIPLLLAGRFEGATQEIKQSITDYMNGWRYEQGIVYNQGETFERYLRRVIKHILDLQKKKTPA